MSWQDDPVRYERVHRRGRRATRAYADLLFTFGFARLKESAEAEVIRSAAADELADLDSDQEFHRLARQSFEYRIAEALRGEPHAGTLDDRCPEVIAAIQVDKRGQPANSTALEQAYHLSRLLQFSRVLEPTRFYDPYARFVRECTMPPQAPWQPRENTEPLPDQLAGAGCSTEAVWRHLGWPVGSGRAELLTFLKQQARAGAIARSPELIAGLVSKPFHIVSRMVLVTAAGLPVFQSSFTTVSVFSRAHLAIVDSLVLAVVGTGSLPPEAEHPERRELLRSLRPSVLAWIDATPVTKE